MKRLRRCSKRYPEAPRDLEVASPALQLAEVSGPSAGGSSAWGNGAQLAAMAAQQTGRAVPTAQSNGRSNPWDTNLSGSGAAGAWWADASSDGSRGRRRRGQDGRRGQKGLFRNRRHRGTTTTLQPTQPVSPQITSTVSPQPGPAVAPQPTPKAPQRTVKAAPELATTVPKPAFAPELTSAPGKSQDVGTEGHDHSYTGKEIITGWRQGNLGNCVTVAAIKNAQSAFGAELANADDPKKGVFKNADWKKDGSLNIEMRDGYTCTVTAAELKLAADHSRFRGGTGGKDMLENAHQIYAVAAKRAQLDGNDGKKGMSYATALATLVKEDTPNIMDQVGRLGLKDYAHDKVPREDLHLFKNTLSSGGGHAYYASYGERDFYGNPGKLGGSGTTTTGRRGRRYTSGKHRPYGTVLYNEKVDKPYGK